MIQFSWEQSLCEEAAWFTYPEGKGCLVGLWLEWEWWLMGISVITETKFCFSTFQRSLASTSVFGGIPMSSQLAITGVGTPFVARFNRTTAVLYPERGPAHTCNGCIQSVVSLCKKRVKKNICIEEMYYLKVSFHPNFLCLNTKRICSYIKSR